MRLGTEEASKRPVYGYYGAMLFGTTESFPQANGLHKQYRRRLGQVVNNAPELSTVQFVQNSS